MAKNRYVNTHFWDDGYITTLDPIEKLLFLYLLTNPLTEISGAYEIPLRRIAFDTGIDRDMVAKIFTRFEEEDKVIYRDGWVLISNFIKHQSVNPKITKGIETSVNHCPNWIKDRLSIAYDRLSHLNLNSNLNYNLNSNSNAAVPQPVENLQELELSDQEWGWPMSEIIASFPNVAFMPAHVGFIEADVKDTPADREAWSATIKLYRENYDPINKSYSPTKTGTLLKIFNEQKAKLKNGTNRNSNGHKQTPGEIIANRPYRTGNTT